MEQWKSNNVSAHTYKKCPTCSCQGKCRVNKSPSYVSQHSEQSEASNSFNDCLIDLRRTFCKGITNPVSSIRKWVNDASFDESDYPRHNNDESTATSVSTIWSQYPRQSFRSVDDDSAETSISDLTSPYSQRFVPSKDFRPNLPAVVEANYSSSHSKNASADDESTSTSVSGLTSYHTQNTKRPLGVFQSDLSVVQERNNPVSRSRSFNACNFFSCSRSDSYVDDDVVIGQLSNKTSPNKKMKMISNLRDEFFHVRQDLSVRFENNMMNENISQSNKKLSESQHISELDLISSKDKIELKNLGTSSQLHSTSIQAQSILRDMKYEEERRKNRFYVKKDRHQSDKGSKEIEILHQTTHKVHNEIKPPNLLRKPRTFEPKALIEIHQILTPSKKTLKKGTKTKRRIKFSFPRSASLIKTKRISGFQKLKLK